MTDTELDEIDALADAATPGPWQALGLMQPAPNYAVIGGGSIPTQVAVVTRENAAFIAAARTALPALIAEVRRLSREVEAIRDARNLAQDMAKQLLDTLACGRF